MFAKLWLRLRYPKELRQLGDATWQLRCDILREPLEDKKGKFNDRRNMVFRQILKCRSIQQFRKYMLKAYGLPLTGPFFPPGPPEDTPPVPALCPNCGPTEVLHITLSLWDGADQQGNATHGIGSHGECRKCNAAIYYDGESAASAYGQLWRIDPYMKRSHF